MLAAIPAWIWVAFFFSVVLSGAFWRWLGDVAKVTGMVMLAGAMIGAPLVGLEHLLMASGLNHEEAANIGSAILWAGIIFGMIGVWIWRVWDASPRD